MTGLRRLVGIGLVALGSCCSLGQSEAQSIRSPAQAQSAPLRLTLTQAHDASGLLFRAALHNNGKQPLTLNLGYAFPYGKQYPDAIHLWLTDARGKTLVLQLKGGVIGGRAEAMVIPLPPDATFDLPIALEDYWAPKEKTWNLELPPGQYKLRAEYTGLDAFHQPVNHTTRRTALMPDWTGTASSNTLMFTLTQKMGRR
jgi:hypothetical protein